LVAALLQDMWALGVIAYEALVGERAVRVGSAHAMASGALLHIYSDHVIAASLMCADVLPMHRNMNTVLSEGEMLLAMSLVHRCDEVHCGTDVCVATLQQRSAPCERQLMHLEHKQTARSLCSLCRSCVSLGGG
jgi:hypothetical protein